MSHSQEKLFFFRFHLLKQGGKSKNRGQIAHSACPLIFLYSNCLDDKPREACLSTFSLIWSAILDGYLWILRVGIVCVKLRCQTINFCNIHHLSTLQYKGKWGGNIPSPLDNFSRPIFILPTSQNRHSSHAEAIPATIIIGE